MEACRTVHIYNTSYNYCLHINCCTHHAVVEKLFVIIANNNPVLARKCHETASFDGCGSIHRKTSGFADKTVRSVNNTCFTSVLLMGSVFVTKRRYRSVRTSTSILWLHQMHEMQTIVTDVRGVCLSACGTFVQPLPNDFGLLSWFYSEHSITRWGYLLINSVRALLLAGRKYLEVDGDVRHGSVNLSTYFDDVVIDWCCDVIANVEFSTSPNVVQFNEWMTDWLERTNEWDKRARYNFSHKLQLQLKMYWLWRSRKSRWSLSLSV